MTPLQLRYLHASILSVKQYTIIIVLLIQTNEFQNLLIAPICQLVISNLLPQGKKEKTRKCHICLVKQILSCSW